MSKYRWATAFEWLKEKHLDGVDVGIVNLLAGLDSDTIQDQYQSEMDADGYFQELDNCALCEDEKPVDELIKCKDCDQRFCNACIDDHGCGEDEDEYA